MRQYGLIVSAAVVTVGVTCAADHTTDSLDTVKMSVSEQKALIVDVREQSEWEDGHLRGAKLVPLSELKAGIPADKLAEKLGKGTVLYLHCGSGKRCLTAADLLKKQGYDVRPLKEGFQTLVKSGFEKDK